MYTTAQIGGENMGKVLQFRNKEGYYDISMPPMTVKRFINQLFCIHDYEYVNLVIGGRKAYVCSKCEKQMLGSIRYDRMM